jgi:hypothetical protein
VAPAYVAGTREHGPLSGAELDNLRAQDTDREQEAKCRLAPELEKLSKLLVVIEEAMRALGQKGWFNKMIGVAKAAKKFKNIDTKINRVLDTVSRGLELDTQQRIYPAEAAVWSKIDGRIAERGGDPMNEDDVREVADGIRADPKQLAAVAKAGGLSEDVIREEVGEMRADLEKMGKSIESMVQGFSEALSSKLRGGGAETGGGGQWTGGQRRWGQMQRGADSRAPRARSGAGPDGGRGGRRTRGVSLCHWGGLSTGGEERRAGRRFGGGAGRGGGGG